jgi:glycosyltransferase involved in cell wall biosynthesis
VNQSAHSTTAPSASCRQRVSVAIATYNGEQHLREQIDSILGQTRLPDEIAISDDASHDRTVQIVREYIRAHDVEIRLSVNKKQLGYSRNFERALELTTGDVIFLCDQDDFWYAHKISRVLSVMREQQKDVAVCDTILADAELNPTAHSQLRAFRIAGHPVEDHCAGCCTALSRRLLPILQPMPHDTLPYDVWISSVASALGQKTVIDEPLQVYRRHPSNVSQWNLSDPDAVRSGRIRRKLTLSDDPRPGWKRLIAGQRAVLDRLDTRSELIRELHLDEPADAAEHRLHAAQSVVARRIALIEQPRWKRWHLVIQMLAAGDYRAFLGVRSALKDLLRSTQNAEEHKLARR